MMHGSAGFVAILVLASFAAAPSAPRSSVAYPVAPRIFVSTNATFAMAGDNVSVEVSSYAGGALVNASSLPVVRAASVGVSVPVSVPVQTGTGRYRASLVLPAHGPKGVWNDVSVEVSATATVAGSQVASGVTVGWATPGAFLRFSSNVRTIHLVQQMHLTAELINVTTHVDADPGSVWFYPIGVSAPYAPFRPNRTGTGVYEADYTLTIGGGNASNPIVGVGANATYRGLALSRSLTYDYAPSVTYAAFDLATYQAWFHTTASNATAVQGDLWIADSWGHPVPGLGVTLTVGPPPTQLTGTTDASGRLPLTINLTGAQTYVMGNLIGPGGVPSPLSWTFPPLPCAYEALGAICTDVAPTDPFVMADGSLRDYLLPGANVSRSYRAMSTYVNGPGTALANEELNYYLLGAGTDTVFAAGHAVTDATGNFSVRFVVPTEDFRILFDVPGGIGSPAEIPYSVPSALMGLRVSPLTLGGSTQVVPSFSSRGTGFALASSLAALALVRPLSASGDRWDEWGPSYGVALEPFSSTDGGLNVSFYLPPFLPSSARYLIDGFAQGGSTVAEQYAVLSPGQSADVPVQQPTGGSPGGGGGVGDILFIAAFGALVAAIAVVGLILILRRRRRVPPPAQPPLSPP